MFNTRTITTIVLTVILSAIMVFAVLLPILNELLGGVTAEMFPNIPSGSIAILIALIGLVPVALALGILIYVFTGALGSGDNRQ